MKITTTAPFTLCSIVVACGQGEGGSARTPNSELEPTEHRHVVRMTDRMTFEPESLVVTVGDTVVWINEGDLPHTSSDTPGKAGVNEHNILPVGAEPWDSGLLSTGDTVSVVFDKPGRYTYLCLIHETAGMVGYVTVAE